MCLLLSDVLKESEEHHCDEAALKLKCFSKRQEGKMSNSLDGFEVGGATDLTVFHLYKHLCVCV